MSEADEFLNEIAGQVVGQELGAIVFVRNYYQFQFDGPMFNVMTVVTVNSALGRARTGDDQFRNYACGQIGKEVRSVSVCEEEAFVISFEDGSDLAFSLKDGDFVWPEAILFQGTSNVWGVFPTARGYSEVDPLDAGRAIGEG